MDGASPEDIARLIEALGSARPFVIVGAGASAPIVPLTDRLQKAVREELFAVGSYPGGSFGDVVPAHNVLFDRIFPNFQARTLEDHLLHFQRSRLELIFQKVLTAPLTQRVPFQYSIFNLLSSRTVLFNYNLDWQASVYNGYYLRVMTPHGSVDREWTATGDWIKNRAASLDFKLPSLRYKCLPGPEPSSVTSRPPFLSARRALQQATALVLIGYSFALNRFGKLDDAESFEYVIDAQNHSDCPVIVVNDRPTFLVDRLRDRFKSKRVKLIQIRWDYFSEGVCKGLASRGAIVDLLTNSGVRSLLKRYIAIQNASAR